MKKIRISFHIIRLEVVHIFTGKLFLKYDFQIKFYTFLISLRITVMLRVAIFCKIIIYYQ